MASDSGCKGKDDRVQGDEEERIRCSGMPLSVGEQPHYIHNFCFHRIRKKSSKTKNR